MRRIKELGVATAAIVTGLTTSLYPSAVSSAQSVPAPSTLGTTAGCGGTELNMAGVTSLNQFNSSLPQQFSTLANDPLIARAINKNYRWIDDYTCSPGHSNQDGQGTTQRDTLAPASQAPAEVDANWAGYRNGDATQYISRVYGEWTVPSVSGQTGYSSVWPGIGDGDNGDYLVQAGTEQDASLPPFGNANYYFWYEVLPNDPNQKVLDKYSPAPGDVVDIEINHDPTARTATFIICDASQNKCFSPMNEPVGGQESKSGVDWVVERTEEDGQYPRLANFGQVHWADAYQVYKGNVQTVNETANYYKLNMDNCSFNQRLANTSALGSDGQTFYDQWVNYGPIENPC